MRLERHSAGTRTASLRALHNSATTKPDGGQHEGPTRGSAAQHDLTASFHRVFRQTTAAGQRPAPGKWHELRHRALTLWNARLRRAALDPKDLAELAELCGLPEREDSQGMNFSSFREKAFEAGRRLERRGLRIETILSAAALWLDACLPRRSRSARDRRGMTPAVARLYALATALIVEGHVRACGAASPFRDRPPPEERESAASLAEIYERERHKLSADLHDGIGHDLVMLKLYLEMVRQDAKRRRHDRVLVKLGEALALLGDTMDSVRRLLLDLRPPVFDDEGILRAVRRYVRQFASRFSIPARLRSRGPLGALPSTHQVALYRVLQGALSNVARHARARGVSVAIKAVPGKSITMVVEDDGVGFDPAKLSAHRTIGLRAMRERVESLGGVFLLEPGKATRTARPGTRLSVVMPLPG